jgi:hypothetical protein
MTPLNRGVPFVMVIITFKFFLILPRFPSF